MQTLRTIAQGELIGQVADNGALVWRGIPYAQPPVGELRWKPPRPPLPWRGRLDAIKDGNACFQSLHLAPPFIDEDGDGFIGSEDCLYLNIFAPTDSTSGDRLPVMYYLPGGGNVGGHNASPAYDGSVLAQTHRVIVVTVNYRLGMMGWFMHPALAAGSNSAIERSGNWGTLDTIRGLEWVRDNIGAFGGDLSNVTIFGESAGGTNVFSLVLSPLARGLFQQAISQSGALLEMPLTTALNYADDEVPGLPNSGPEVVNAILIRDGQAKDRAAAKALQSAMSAAQIRQLLYSQTPAQLHHIVNPSGARLYPAPRLFSDGAVLPDVPALQIFASGRFNRVPLIIGTNRDERRLYQLLEPSWQKVLKECPQDYMSYAAYGSLAWKQRHVDDVARAMAGAGHDALYIYRFDWDEEGIIHGMDFSTAVGAGHTVEIPFVFGQWNSLLVPLGDCDEPQRRALSASVMSYWAQMAYTGTPGKGRSGTEIEWKQWNNTAGKEKMILFDSATDGGIRMSCEEVTAQSLKTALVNDKSFKDRQLQSTLFKALFPEEENKGA
ncbi:MAG: carboxylesterase family protein [Desulfobacteraceae bacterium]|nr:carboxylesterase family protein [Desulfobacteraceae bacterium]